MIRSKKSYALLALLLTLVMMFSLSASFYLGISIPVAEAATTIEQYYSGLNTSLTGDAFQDELEELITSTHTYNPSYDNLREVFQTTDADPNKSGNIILFYTGTSVAFNGSFNSGVNREHVWPKDGGDAFPAETQTGSDAHHLRPANQQLNSTRGSNSFGEVAQTSTNIVKEAGSTSYANLCYQAGGLFYPGEGYRGATARILMYVQTRWGSTYNLTFVDSAGKCKTIGKISDLIKWHIEEPPTAEEIRRNDAVYAIQGNRNPFIDHPEYAEMIYCYDGESYNSTLQNVYDTYSVDTTLDVTNISISPTTVMLSPGGTQALTTSFTPVNATTTLTWTSSDSTIASVNSAGVVTAHQNGTVTITATNTKNTSVKASVTVKVVSLSSIAVSGTPTKTSYYTGEVFDPTGLTVTATYSDSSTSTIPLASCQWLDPTSLTTALSAGSTSVICKYSGLQATVSGITVETFTGSSFTITQPSFTKNGSSYNWLTWSSNGISGQGYIYYQDGYIQMNNSKSYRYIFNTTAVPGKITSITITLSTGKTSTGTNTFEVRTSSTAYTANVNTYPTTGTSHGSKEVTTSGTTWEISGNDSYFTINYTGTNAIYVESIEIKYEISTHEHVYGDWISTIPATETSVGTKGHYTCSECGKYFDDDYNELTDLTIPKLEHVHSFGSWIEEIPATETSVGTLGHYTCTGCSKNFAEDRTTVLTSLVIEKLEHSHVWGEWVEEVPATETSIGKKGYYYCSSCNKYYESDKVTEIIDLNIDKLPHVHSLGTLVEEVPATQTTVGTKAHYTCSGCGKHFAEDGETELTNLTIPKLEGGGECVHNYGTLIPEVPATETSIGTKAHYTCSICLAHFDEEYNEITDLTIPMLNHSHTYGEWIDEVPATETSVGTKGHYTCSGCGKHFDSEHVEISTLTIPVLTHVHEYGEWIAEIPATEISVGTKGHYTCASCGLHFDSEHVEISDLTIAIIQHVHNYGQWIAEIPATETSVGTKGHYTCSGCNKHFDSSKNELSSLTIPVLPINYSAFSQSVDAISNATTQQAKYEAILNALTEYNKLSDIAKLYAQDDYEQLVVEIENYNALVAPHNNEMDDAISTAFASIAGCLSIFAIALYLIKSRLM